MKSLLPLPALVLLAATPWAGAQTELPDPVAPAVIGRPLDQIIPLKPQRASQTPRPRPARVAAPPRPRPTSVAVVAAPAAIQAAPSPHSLARQSLDGQAAGASQVPDNVGQGQRLGKALGPGAYFGPSVQELVRRHYAQQPAPAHPSSWQIGAALPPRARVSGVPDALRAALPKLPPGHQYVQVDGEVVLLARQSRMVVDGIPRQR